MGTCHHPLYTAPFRRTTTRLCLTLLLTAAGCDKSGSSSPAAPPAATPTTADAQSSGQTGEAASCRDWSDLDVASLEPIPQSQWSQTFEAMWRAVLEKHYDPTLGCLDWPALRQQYATKLASAKDEAAAYEVMNGLLGELGQSHLAIRPPQQEAAGEPRASGPLGDAVVPLRARYIEDKVIVVDPAVDGKRSGIPGGAELVAIDDHEVAPLVEAQKKKWDRPVETAFHVTRTVSFLLTCKPGAKKTIRYIPFGKDEPKQKKVKCLERKVEKISMGNLENIPVEVEHRMIEGTKIGYLRFNIWMVPLMPKIETALTKLRNKGMKGLVLDLRGNPGGVGMMVVPLARQMLSESTSLGTMHMREAEQHFKVEAQEGSFEGPVAVLVDAGTGSTSEIFAQAMRDLDRIQVFGASPSQGAALPSLVEELPGGAILQYVVADYKSPTGSTVEGKGVTPDVTVKETQADFANGKDPVLAAAVEALSSKPAKTG